MPDYVPGSTASLPSGAADRLRAMRGTGEHPAFFTSDLTIDEFLLIEQAGERICAHPARIRTNVPIAETLMVLRRDQRRNVFTVTNYQKRNFIAVETFFKHYACAGFADQLAGEHFAGGGQSLVFVFAHDHALSRRQAIRLDHNRRTESRERVLNLG